MATTRVDQLIHHHHHLLLLLVVYMVVLLGSSSRVGASSSSSSSEAAEEEEAVPAVVCKPEHASALLEFKRLAIEDDPSGTWLSSWNLVAAADCCSWRGVRCGDGDNNRGLVIGIELSNCNGYDPTDAAVLERNQQENALRGSLTADALRALANVSSTLSVLDLSCHLFHGIVPREIGGLVALSYLDLSFQAQSYLHRNDSAHVLSGPIPDELWGLPRLAYLDLGYNSILGAISELAGSCASLTALRLGTNNLTGAVPASIGSLSRLETLDLSSNEGLASLPADGWNPSFVGIQTLDISFCGFRGAFPAWLRRLTNLSTFTLAGNEFEGAIPDWAWGMATDSLDLSGNKFDSRLSCASGPSPPASLTSLDVSYNGGISGTLPCFIANLTNLTTLSFAGNSLHGPIPDVFARLAALQFLDLSENRLGGVVPASMQHLQSLANLDLDTNLLAPQAVPSFLLGLPSIARLDLSANNFTAIGDADDAGGGRSIGNSTLKFLKLTSNRISGRIPGALFVSHPNLEFLRLDGNRLTGAVPETLSRLSQLQTLDLSHNSLAGPLPSSLSNLSSLIIFNLNGNPIGGPVPGFVGSLAGLLALDLGSCGLDGSIPRSLAPSLRQLQVLILSGNRLSGAIPASLGELQGMIHPDQGSSAVAIVEHEDYITDDLAVTLKAESQAYSHLELLTDLDLSDNRLEGPIPPELGDLGQLRFLNLSGNRLNGSIPSELGGLTKLEALDLSENALEGEIPQSFNDLTALAFVNLSSNRLSGSIPSSPQWIQTFNISSFQDNAGLCTDVPSSLAKLPPCSSSSSAPGPSSPAQASASAHTGFIDWFGFFAVGYPVGFLLGLLCILAHLVYKHRSLRRAIWQFRHPWSLQPSNEDPSKINGAKYPAVEEGTSNQDWQAILARIREELSTSSFVHIPMQVGFDWSSAQYQSNHGGSSGSTKAEGEKK